MADSIEEKELKFIPMDNDQSVEQFLRDNKLKNRDAYGLNTLAEGIYNKGQLKIMRDSQNAFAKELKAAVRNLKEYQGQEVRLAYNEKTNTIECLTYNKGLDFDKLKQEIETGGSQSRKELDRDKARQFGIPLPDVATRGTTVGGGKIANVNIASFGKRGGEDKFLKVPTFMLTQLNSSLGGKPNRGVEGVGEAISSMRRATEAVYSRLSKEAREEARAAQKIRGTSDIHFIENAIKSAEAQMADYIKRLAYAYDIVGRSEKDFMFMAAQIMKSKDPMATANVIANSKEFRELWGKRAPSHTKMVALTNRLADFGQKYQLWETTYKNANEQALARGSLGQFDYIEQFLDRISNEVKRAQNNAQADRIVTDEVQETYRKSGLVSTSAQKAAGLHRGKGFKKGDLLPYDAQVLGLVSGIGKFKTEDTVFVSDALAEAFTFIREFPNKVKNQIDEKGKNVLEERKAEAVNFLEKLETAKQIADYTGKAETRAFSTLTGEDRDRLIYYAIFKQLAKETHRHSNFTADYKNFYEIDKDTGDLTLFGKEEVRSGVGSVALGSAIKAPIDKRYVMVNGKQKNYVDNLHNNGNGNVQFVHDISELGNVRKGGEIYDLMLNTLFQEYGNDLGLHYKVDLREVIKNSINDTTDASLKVALTAIQSGIEGRTNDGRYAVDMSKIIPALKEGTKEAKGNTGAAMVSLMEAIDRLINGLDKNTNTIEKNYETGKKDGFKNDKKNPKYYFKYDDNHALQYTGKDIRAFEAAHSRAAQTEWGRTNWTKPLRSELGKLKRLHDSGKIDDKTYEKLRDGYEADYKENIAATEKDITKQQNASIAAKEVLRKSTESGTKKFDKNATYHSGGKRYLIQIVDDEQAAADTGKDNIISIKASELEKAKTNSEGAVQNLDKTAVGRLRKEAAKIIAEKNQHADIDFGVGMQYALNDKYGGTIMYINPETIGTEENPMPSTLKSLETLDDIATAMRDEGSKTAADLVPQYFENMDYDINKEGGQIYENTQGRPVESSRSFTVVKMDENWITDAAEKEATAFDKFRGEVAQTGALVTKDIFKESLGQYKSIEKYNMLKKLYKAAGLDLPKGSIEGGLDNKIMSLFTLEGEEGETAAARQLIEALSKKGNLDAYQSFAKMALARSPYDQVLTNLWIAPFLSQNLTRDQGDQPAIKLGSSIMDHLSGDYDSDVVSALVKLGPGMRNLSAAAMKYDAEMLQGFKLIREDEKQKPPEALTPKIGEQLASENLGVIAALQERFNKQYTGIFGNIRGNFDTYLAKKADNRETFTPADEMAAAIFRGIGQDTISSKKTVAKIIGIDEKDWDTKTPEQLADAYTNGLNNLVEQFYNSKSFDDFWEALGEENGVGLVKKYEDANGVEHEEFAPDKKDILRKARLTLMQSESGRQLLAKELGLEEGSDDEKTLIAMDGIGALNTMYRTGGDKEKALAGKIIAGFSQGMTKEFVQQVFTALSTTQNDPMEIVRKMANKSLWQPEKDAPDVIKSIEQNKDIAENKMSAELAENTGASKTLAETIQDLQEVMIAMMKGGLGGGAGGGLPTMAAATKETGPIAITTAIKRILPYRDVLDATKDNDPRKADSGIFGHKILEIFGQEKDFDYTTNAEYKAAEEAYKESLKGLTEEQKDRKVAEARQRAETLRAAALEGGNREMVATEVSIGDVTKGLHGRLDALIMETTEEGLKKLINTDWKFSENPGTRRNLLEVFFQSALMQEDRGILQGLVADQGGSWRDNGQVGWSNENRGLMIEGKTNEAAVDAVIEAFVEKMQARMGSQFRDLEQKNPNQAATLKKNWAAYGRALMEADVFGTEVMGSNKKNEVAKYLLNANVNPQTVQRLLSGEFSQEDWYAATEAIQTMGYSSQGGRRRRSRLAQDLQQGLSMNMYGLMRGGFSGKAIQSLIKELKQAYATILQLDQAVTNLQIVTGKNDEQAREMISTYNEMAQELGTTTVAIATAGTEWLRQGYNAAETEKLIKSSTYLATLGFMDESSAVRALTSAMKGFNLEASDSMSIVDKLTTLDAKYATTAGDLATALSYTASVASEAGMNMDETLAALTTIIDVTQMDSSSAGNAMKSMLSRFGNVKAGKFAEGEDSEGINDIERVLNTIGVKIRSSATEMRNYTDVLADVAEQWDYLSDVERNAIATAMAGTRQRNAFTSLLSNYSTFESALKDQQDSSGTADEKYEAKKDSIEYSKAQMKAAAEEFVDRMEASGIIKGIYKSLAWLAQNLDWIVPLITTTIITGLGVHRDQLEGLQIPLIGSINSLTSSIDNLNSTINGTAAQATGASTTSMRERFFGKSVTSSELTKYKRGYTKQNGIWYDASGKQAGKNVAQHLDNMTLYNGKVITRDNADNWVYAAGGGMVAKAHSAKANQIQEGKANVGRFRSNAGYAAFAGISTGLFYGMSGGGVIGNAIDKKSGISDYENSATNTMTGIVSGAGAAIGAIWGPLGSLIGSLVGDAVSSVIKAIWLKDEKERGERIKAAKEQLEALSNIKSSIDNANNALEKDFADWEASDWETWNKAVEEMKEIDFGADTLKFTNALDDVGATVTTTEQAFTALTNRTEDATKVMAAYQAAVLEMEAEATYKATENERLELINKLSTTEDKDERKSIQNKLDAYEEALATSYMQSAFLRTGYSTKSTGELYGESIDNLILKVAEKWATNFPDIKKDLYTSEGLVTQEYASKILNHLKTQSNLGTLVSGSNVSVKGALANQGLFDGYTYSELRKQALSKDGGSLLTRFAGANTAEALNAARNLILNYNPDNIERTARGLSMTKEQLEEISENLWYISSGDVLSGFDTLNDKLGTMSSILEDIVEDSALSGENLKALMENFPGLMGELTSFSSKEIIEQLTKTLTDKKTFNALVGSQVNGMMSDQTFWSNIKASFEGHWEDLFGENAKFDEAALNAASSLQDVFYMFSGNDTAKKKLSEIMATLTEDYEYLDAVIESITKYQVKMYDNEIDNLQSIKDSLEDVNKQREKELELVKAKQALENAQKEKKRVYMAGIGWTYMADQQAVKEAQEKVDELERQQTQDDIQYQIDVLEQQKNLLESIEEELSWKNLETLFNTVMGTGEGKNNTVWGAINALQTEQANLVTTIQAAFPAQENSIVAGAEKEYTTALEAYNQSLKKLKGSKYKEIETNADEATSAGKAAEAAYTKYEETYKNYHQGRTDGITSSKVGDVTTEVPKAKEEASNNYLTGYDAIRNLEPGYYEVIDTDYNRLKKVEDNNNKHARLLVRGDETYATAHNSFKSKLSLSDLWAVTVYGVGSKNDATWGQVWIPKDAEGVKANASGSLSFSGGSTLINEKGLEGIITPQGTLTSLPAKSGILPADITKNLWALGEVAPNLVARVEGTSVLPGDSTATTDNSMTVGTLNATFNTDSSFDGARFWSDVKSQIILTKNNH